MVNGQPKRNRLDWPAMKMKMKAILFLFILLCGRPSLGQLDEGERVAQYRARNHAWPPRPSDYLPDLPKWASLHARRFDQIDRIEDTQSKYNAYISAVHSALLAPNFTEYGWGLTRAPDDLVDALAERLRRGLEGGNAREEVFQWSVSDEYPDELPLMVNAGYKLVDRAMRELLPLQEAWARTELVANNAYGLRVYRNNSNLQMHVDESATHVISSILHVGHDPEGEPWPLVLEDLKGNTNEVFLEVGDLLLYESSKCFHGRPRRYNGGWYSSLFTHYYPVDWDEKKMEMDAHFRIPPNWAEVPDEKIEGLEELVVTETSFREPGCEHEWCGMRETVKWERPPELEFGEVITGDGEIRSLGLDTGSQGGSEDEELEL
ncbi:hypothetical protein ACHAWF_017920 [Thalassiosira exigua]